MEQIGQFKNDQLAVLDLLFRKFSLLADFKNKSLPKVDIYIGDLQHYKLPREVFAEAIRSFKNDALKILKIVDQDELEGHFHREDPIDEPSVFEVQLPSNFPALCNRMTSDKYSIKRRGQVKDSSNRNIEGLLCVIPKNAGKRYRIVINGDYNNPLEVDSTKPSWRLLLSVAKKECASYSENKSSVDYFNSNKRNRIYTKTGAKLTKILKVENGDVVPNIKLGTITEKAHKTRINRLNVA